MNNLERMKNSFISSIENMTERQFYNFLFLFEEDYHDPDFEERYGIDMSDMFMCENCKKEQHGCPIEPDTESDEGLKVCYTFYHRYSEKTV